MAGLKHFIHDNGRRCTWHDHDGTWRHWDHPDGEPGPKERVDYVCRMDHPLSEVQSGPLPELEPEDILKDRGDFGMPHLGTFMRDVDPGAILSRIAGSIGKRVEGDRLVNMYDWPKTTINVEGVWYDYGEQGNRIEPQTEQAKRILGDHLPDVMAHFIERNAEYGEEAHVLGVKGQYADINRKVIKLKRYLWDDVPVPEGAEDIPTIAGELIGHLLILIDELDKENN